MGIVASVAFIAIYVFFLGLLLRIALDMIHSYAPRYRPSGAVLVAHVAIYTVTDPPVKSLRALIPPLRLGTIALDLSVIVIFLGCSIALQALSRFVV